MHPLRGVCRAMPTPSEDPLCPGRTCGGGGKYRLRRFFAGRHSTAAALNGPHPVGAQPVILFGRRGALFAGGPLCKNTLAARC